MLKFSKQNTAVAVSEKLAEINKQNRFFVENLLVVLRRVYFKKPIPVPSQIITLDIQQTGFTSLNFLVQILEKTGQPGFKYERCSMPSKPRICPNFMKRGDVGGLALDNGLRKNPEDYKQYTFVNGHIPWWPDLAKITNAKGITAVRRPTGIDGRVVADANFAYARGYIKNKQEAEQYIRSYVDNLQTRMIAGVEYMDGECTKETLERAKENIEKHFLLVWATDADMNKFIEILASILGWGDIALPKRTQVSGDKIFANELDISAELKAYIEEANKFDTELYAFVRARMEKWLEENVAGYKEVPPEALVRCVVPEYAKDRIPVIELKARIDEWNSRNASSPRLLETMQNWPDNYDEIEPKFGLPRARL